MSGHASSAAALDAVADEWARALCDFDAAMSRLGRSPSTVQRVIDHMRAYAGHTPTLGPWQAVPASVDRWLDI